ncbi:semaphorin-4F isoform X1 [Paramormyrops kingsleyae]|uniref:Ssemaphorin 4F n=1 Tax=Paramormyrops kingsleyae TaxID=1676925 RepID=A0A3B3QKA4_9TELE|nr:semaphorin-4F-like [Paramormyrops kingsleyae]
MKTAVDWVAEVYLFCFIPCYWTASIGGTYGNANLQQFYNLSNFSTFLLDPSTATLYLGARDAILAIDTNDLTKRAKQIVWDVPKSKQDACVAKGKTEGDCHNYIRLLEFMNSSSIYACGTYAYYPQCVTIDVKSFSLKRTPNGEVEMETGKGKCPFEPSQHYAAVMADGVLYTAATSNFLGTLFDISRATGNEGERIRTEQSINWLNDPEFVSSAFIKEDPNNPIGEDDKIYFFFTEVAREYDLYTKVKVSRVARVCKGDVGGMKTLQKRWTTFLKAQLVCEDRISGQRYNILTDVYTTDVREGDPSSTHFYGIFTSQWEREPLSAVCAYSLEDIKKVMAGPFKELKKNCENWNNPEPIPSPRPGQCITKALKGEGFESSLKLPDKVLTYVRDHPLMENSVMAAPLLVRRGVTYTKIAVSHASDSQGGDVVLHLGTDRGQLHRVLVEGQNTSILLESPIFPFQEPVNNILLYKGRALVGSPQSLMSLPVDGCEQYSSCETCALVRRLGCMWRTKAGAPACVKALGGIPQGAEPEDPLGRCGVGEARCHPTVKDFRVMTGMHVVLSCEQLSPRSCYWVHPDGRHTWQRHLEVMVSSDSVGIYTCFCEEGGREQPPCRKAEYQLAMDAPCMGVVEALTGTRHVVAGYPVCFFAGAFLGCLLYIMCVGHRTTHMPEKNGRDFLQSSDTPLSPSSASLLSEGVPLTEKRNGTLNGHSVYGNSGGHKLPESAVNRAVEVDGKEPEETAEQLEEEMTSGMDEFGELKNPKAAPLAPFEESSI